MALSIKIFDLQPESATFMEANTQKVFQVLEVDPNFSESAQYTMSIWVQKRDWNEKWNMFMRMSVYK